MCKMSFNFKQNQGLCEPMIDPLSIKNEIVTPFCRLCLISVGVFQPLFSKDNSNDDILDKILKCTGLKLDPVIDQDDHICLECIDMLDKCIYFVQKCQANNEIILKNRNLEADKLEEVHQAHKSIQPKIEKVRVVVSKKVQKSDTKLENIKKEPPGTLKKEQPSVIPNEKFVGRNCYQPNLIGQETGNNLREIQKHNCGYSAKQTKSVARPKRSLIDVAAKSKTIQKPSAGKVYKQNSRIQPTNSHPANIQTKNHVIDKDEKKFECDICNKTFLNATHLRSHNTSVHTGEKPYRCTVCGELFSSARQMSNHRHRLY